MEDAVELQM